MHRHSWILIAALLCTGVACVHHHGAAPDGTLQSERTVFLDVINNSSIAMEIFAVGSGITYRMGTVSPGLSSHFVFPKTMIGNGPIEIQAHASGGGGELIRSGRLMLSSGQVVDFRIGTHQLNSTVTVRP